MQRPTDVPIDKQTFRTCMRQVPGAVSVITTLHDGVRSGMTATAVCSVSAEPPQLLICINRTASSQPLIAASGRFGVSFLAHHHQSVADSFSSTVEDRFATATWTELGSGIPVLEDAVAAFDCVVTQMVEAGTHTVFIGLIVGAAAREGQNLVYKAGNYATL